MTTFNEEAFCLQAAELVKAARARASLTKEQVAERLGTTPATIWKLEAGELKLTVGMMGRLADVLGCSPSDFLPQS